MLDELLSWKNRANKRALLIKGARQVGKTYIIREFGKANYKNFIEINFEEQPFAKNAFTDDLSPRTIIQKLSLMGFGPFENGKTLIFFDEIQSCPKARTAIKFLVEDGRFDYIESGSLLGINYRDVSSYPVGFEDCTTMYPLDFEEFLWAKGIMPEVIDTIRDACKTVTPLDSVMHKRAMQLFQEYLIVGGMPAAVKAFLNSDDFTETLRAQKSILDSYRDDISKYADKEKSLVKQTFDAIPEQLNQKNKRFILADIEKGAKSKKFENATQWLVEAGIAYNCFNVTALEIPLSFNEKRNLYKLYMHDTGLLCAQGYKNIQGAVLNGEININEGAVAENAVASALSANGIPLNYYDRKSRSELDFVFAENNKLSIIEVKSGRDFKKHASLDETKTIKQLGRRIVLCKSNIEKSDDGIIYLPIYMAMFL